MNNPTLHDQHHETYRQTYLPSQTHTQGLRVNRHDFDYQQYNPRPIDNSETSSTATVVGSWNPQP